MRTLYCAVVLLFSLISIADCAKTLPKEVRLLQWVEKADPIEDAKAALARNDFTLIGIHGFTWSIPGTEESQKFEYEKKYGVRLIDGTGDVIHSDEHGRLINLATSYAGKYNQYLLHHAGQK